MRLAFMAVNPLVRISPTSHKSPRYVSPLMYAACLQWTPSARITCHVVPLFSTSCRRYIHDIIYVLSSSRSSLMKSLFDEVSAT